MEETLLRFIRTELLGDADAPIAVDSDILADGTLDIVALGRLLEFIEQEFHVAIDTDDVTPDRFSSVSTIVDHVRALRSDAAGLTNAQQMLWTNQQLYPDVPLYNTAFLFEIDGALDVPAFTAAFSGLIDDAEALRTVVATDDGVPRQAVMSSSRFVLPIVDLSGADDPGDAARRWAEARARIPLAVEDATFDAALLKLGDERFAWYFAQHHIVSDAWALGLLYERLEARYVAARDGSGDGFEPFPSYAGYIDLERTLRDTAPGVQRRSNGNAGSALALYGRRPDTSVADSERVSMNLSDERSRALASLANRPGIRALTPDLSTFQIMATALASFIHRVSGQTALTIGVPVHNRSTPEFRRLPGLFMEVYPLAVDVVSDDTFASLHRRIATATTELIRSAKPGQATAAANRDISVVLNHLTVRFPPFGGSPVRPLWIHTGAVDPQHVLRVQVHDFDDSGRLTISLDMDSVTFDADTRSAMPTHLLRVLDAMIEDWEHDIASVPLVDARERESIERAVAGGRPDSGEPAPDVVSQFRGWVERDPAATAMTDGTRSVTYAELDEITARIAAGISPGSTVGIGLGRSIDAVCCMLGVQRAGAAYVPIDRKWPVERIDFVVGDAGIDLLIADDDLGVSCRTMSYEDATAMRPGRSVDIGERDLAYVLYTSGSTGAPKGVMVEHRALSNYVSWASRFYDRGQRLTFPLFTALTFDLTVTSIFVPLVSGGTIRVYPDTPGRTDLSIVEVFDDDCVDIVKLTPSHLALVVESGPRPSRIRQLILGGEDLTAAVARRAAALFDDPPQIHNEYGPTEATVGCVVHTYDPASDVDGSVPIGRPIDGAGAHVVDTAGQAVPLGVPGELWISGTGLARGYVGRPDLTAERFVEADGLGGVTAYRTGDIARVRPSGIIEYLGRTDDQVKIKGIRVELGEIESALTSHPGVSAAAARLWEPADARQDADPIHCVRCGLASNYPGVSFGEDRVCSECRGFDEYGAKARVYFKPEEELSSILTSQRDRSGAYDCISLLSGGKDSTYVLARLVDMGMRVLAFTLDNGYLSDQAKGNIDRVVEALGVDHRYASTPAMNEIFVDSLERHANVCNGCFKTIYTLSIQTALEDDIPFIVTGLSRGQFFETRLTADLFTDLTVSADQIDANVLEARKAYHRVDDAVNRNLDVSIFDDDQVFEDVRFVDFYRYVDVPLDELYAYLDERLPWVRPTDTGRSTNCLINDVGIYYHRKVRGYHNYALPYSWDVRMGHKSREAALAELDDDIDVSAVARILDEIGFPEDVTGAESGRTLVSYYAAPVEIPTPELRRHLSTKLPEPLVPSRFVRLDALPLTANGKVDREALPSPDHQRPQIETAFVAPRSERERTLARIWENVLGVEGIGVRDNYFDLGGDSISAVQIIARAHRQGIALTMHQLADELTIEKLAAATSAVDATRAERVVGAVDLLPIQRWFFEEVTEEGYFHHAVLIDPGGPVDEGDLGRALDVLVDHHDALRQSFHREAGEWHSSVADDLGTVPSHIVEVDGPRFDMESAPSELLAPFDLAAPPLIRVAVLRAPDGDVGILMVAHHLIVDAVSWSHLVDDLGHLMRSDATPVESLPPVITSVREWGEMLSDASVSLDAGPWREVAGRPAPSWPLDDGEDTWETGIRSIGPRSSDRLLADVAAAGIGLDEALVASLASSLASHFDADRVRLYLEGHGRDSDAADVDVTRTMGWFTSLYPVVIEPFPASSADDLARTVRTQIRDVIARGRDYGALRYLHPDPRVRDGLALDHARHLVVNFLGRVATPGDDRESFRLDGPIRLIRPTGQNRIFGAEITAWIGDDGLTIECGTASRSFERLESIVMRTLDQLTALAEGSGPADEAHDLSGLDSAGMAKLAALLEVSDGGGSS